MLINRGTQVDLQGYRIMLVPPDFAGDTSLGQLGSNSAAKHKLPEGEPWMGTDSMVLWTRGNPSQYSEPIGSETEWVQV